MATARILPILVATLVASPATAISSALEAQPAAGLTHTIAARVPAVLAVRKHTTPRFRAGATAHASTQLQVGANARYDVLVRLEAASAADSIAFFVRDASGEYRRLGTERPVAITRDAPAGVSTIAIAWRAEGVGARGATPRIAFLLIESSSAAARAD
jgi:hypothetical protein